jgi:hypothetical protein
MNMKKYILYTKLGCGYGSGFVAADCNGKPHCSTRFIGSAFQFTSKKDAELAQANLCRSSVILTYTEARNLEKTIFAAMSKTIQTKKGWKLACTL